jgi:hypothetical protein
MNADVSTGARNRLVLVPEFRRLIADVPVVLLVARREVTFLGEGNLLVGADTHYDAGERFGILIDFVLSGLVVDPVTFALSAEGILERLGLEVLATGDAVYDAVRERPLLSESLSF